MRIKVVAIEDDPLILQMLQEGFPSAEFSLDGFKDPEKGLTAISQIKPDILLLDWNLPGISGLEVCKRLRHDGATKKLPIIMLTALEQTASKVAALEMGADDYITKPFQPSELIARVRAVLRRLDPGVVPSEVINRGCIEISGSNYQVAVKGKPVALSTMEFDILYLLAKRENRPLTREVLLEHACPTTTETLRTIDVHITHLRRKLGPVAGEYIKTVHRVGYVFSVK